METGTPGQIFGVTHKTDGKSSNWTSSASKAQRSNAENVSSEFTQGPKTDEYEKVDKSATGEPEQERQSKQKMFVAVGIAMVVVFVYLLSKYSAEERMRMEQERALAAYHARQHKQSDGFSDA